MLQTTLLELDKILKNSKLNKEEQNSFLLNFKKYKLSDWVYPGILKRLTHIKICDIYYILNELEKKGIVDSYFEIYCECGKTIGEVYKKISDIPLSVYCDNCNEEIESDKHAVLIYRVKENG